MCKIRSSDSICTNGNGNYGETADIKNMKNRKGLLHALLILKDVSIFLILSVYFIAESIILTIIPDRFRKLKDLNGQVALITGGGSGVGRILALKLARQGCKVVVWDISKEGLTRTCELINGEGLQAKGYVCDVSHKIDVYRIAALVKEEVGPVDILVNNAGIVYGHTLLELPDSAIENTYKVNILSHYWTAKAFLPDMLSRKQGHIVTVGSVAGMLGTYRCTDYSATKAAAIAYHESLFSELRAHGHDYIHLTIVNPFFINTGMFGGATPRLMPMLEPDYVAESIVSSIKKNEVNCVLPDSARVMMPLKNLLPAKMSWELMHRVMQGPKTMMEFRGHPRAIAG